MNIFGRWAKIANQESLQEMALPAFVPQKRAFRRPPRQSSSDKRL